MSKSRGSHGEAGRAVQQGVKKVFGNTKKAVATGFCRYSRQAGPPLPRFTGRFMRASVFVLYLISTDCSTVVFISFIPAVAQGICRARSSRIAWNRSLIDSNHEKETASLLWSLSHCEADKSQAGPIRKAVMRFTPLFFQCRTSLPKC